MNYRPFKPVWEVLGFLWCLPNTLIGLLLLLAAGGPKVTERYGLLRFRFQPRWMWYFPKMFCGMSWGAVNMFRDWPMPDRVLIHEDAHTCQGFILGPFQLVLYPLFSLVSALLYGKVYQLNWLEMTARDVAGERVDAIDDLKK